MLGLNTLKNKVIKKANKIIKKGGGASPKNKVLINSVLKYLKENEMTPENFEKELRSGKGKGIIGMTVKMLQGNKQTVEKFINDFMNEVKIEYYKKEK